MTRDEYRARQRRPMRVAAFRDAWNGLRVLVGTQPNARFHLLATAGVLGAGFFFRLAAWEWVAVIIAIVVVWAVEALNTAVEFVVDLVSPEHHFLAGWAKDIAAGAVLVASMGAVVVALLVFSPHVAALLKQWPTSAH